MPGKWLNKALEVGGGLLIFSLKKILDLLLHFTLAEELISSSSFILTNSFTEVSNTEKILENYNATMEDGKT